MFPATVLLQNFSHTDAGKLLGLFRERQFLADELVIAEGQVPTDLYFVIHGVVSVYVEGAAGQRRELAHLGAGEILGDVGWLEGSSASASVRAKEISLLATVSAKDLEALLASDASFASRFYRGLAQLNAARVRRLTREFKSKELHSPRLEEGDAAERLLELLRDLKAVMVRAEREAIAGNGVMKAGTISDVHAALGALSDELNRFMQAGSDSEALKAEVGAMAQRECLSYVLISTFAERVFSKPRGYAGDCETIGLIYRNRPKGSGRLGAIVDSFFLSRPAPEAVRNRRSLLEGEILGTVSLGGPAHVTSLACGPAEELFDIFARLDDKGNLRCTVIDIDPKAIELVTCRASAEGLSGQITARRANLVYLATGKERLSIPPQSLVYSVGLIDYFQDEFVINLLNWIYDLLAPGGRAVLGNFHPRNPDRAFMDHVLEWRLIHRTEDDMHRLFRASRFGTDCSRILFEEQRINLFAEGIKPA